MMCEKIDGLVFEVIGTELAEDGKKIQGFGISVKDNNEEELFANLCGSEEKVSRFVTLCNDSDVSRYHLRDIMDDFVTGLYI